MCRCRYVRGINVYIVRTCRYRYRSVSHRDTTRDININTTYTAYTGANRYRTFVLPVMYVHTINKGFRFLNSHTYMHSDCTLIVNTYSRKLLEKKIIFSLNIIYISLIILFFLNVMQSIYLCMYI